MAYDRLLRTLDVEDPKSFDSERIEGLQDAVRRFERPLSHMCMEAGLPPEVFFRRRMRREAARAGSGT